MFLLDEKIMTTAPFISVWNNGEQLKTRYRSLDIDISEDKEQHEDVVEREIKKWEQYFAHDNERMTGGFVRYSPISLIKEPAISIDGISSTFSKIKTQEQLLDFATNYGNLCLHLPQKNIDLFEKLSMFDPNIVLNSINAFENVQPGFSYFEPFELWWHHIDKVKKILRLYRALSREYRGLEADIEDSILIIGEETYSQKQPAFEVDWWDGSSTHVKVLEKDIMDFTKIGRLVLRKSIERYASKGIELKASEIVETSKNEIGFYVLEKKTTDYLITAIYYDLWKLINKNLVVEICQNPNCRDPFVKIKRQQYCSDACKQEAYRIRKAAIDNRSY